MSNICCKCNCVVLALISSIALGIVASVLLFTAVITVTATFYWVALGIAVGFLALTLVAVPRTSCFDSSSCFCYILTAILAGALGTILTALILLGVGFAATSALGAVVFGILIFLEALLLTSVACFIKYIAGCAS